MPDTTTRSNLRTRPMSSTENSQPVGAGELQPSVDLIDYAKEYARAKPEVAALWCLGVGFILGWKLKPW